MFKNSKAFAGFAVDDLEKAKVFYADKLGLNLKTGPMGILEIQLSGGGRVIIYRRDHHVPAQFTVLNFPVDDVDKAVDQLTKVGIAMERYENLGQDIKGIARGNGPDIAWFKDPAGNILSVLKATR